MLHIVNILRVGDPAPLGDFELLVLLALLRLGNGAYGAAIRREILQKTGRGMSTSAAYVTLQRLEAKGFVCSYLGDPAAERGGRRRKHYLLHEAGQRALACACHGLSRMLEGLEAELAAMHVASNSR